MKREYQILHDDYAIRLEGGERVFFPLGDVFITVEAGKSDGELRAAWRLINLLAEQFSMKFISERKESSNV